MVNPPLREFLEYGFILSRIDRPGHQEIGRGERRGKDEQIPIPVPSFGIDEYE
jgi:hypothetical protein